MEGEKCDKGIISNGPLVRKSMLSSFVLCTFSSRILSLYHVDIMESALSYAWNECLLLEYSEIVFSGMIEFCQVIVVCATSALEEDMLVCASISAFQLFYFVCSPYRDMFLK